MTSEQLEKHFKVFFRAVQHQLKIRSLLSASSSVLNEAFFTSSSSSPFPLGRWKGRRKEEGGRGRRSSNGAVSEQLLKMNLDEFH